MPAEVAASTAVYWATVVIFVGPVWGMSGARRPPRRTSPGFEAQACILGRFLATAVAELYSSLCSLYRTHPYICVYVYMCIVYVCICAYVYVYVHVCVYAYIYMYMYMYMYMHMYLFVFAVFIFVYVFVFVLVSVKGCTV